MLDWCSQFTHPFYSLEWNANSPCTFMFGCKRQMPHPCLGSTLLCTKQTSLHIIHVLNLLTAFKIVTLCQEINTGLGESTEYTVLTHIGVWVKTKINILYPRCKFNISCKKYSVIFIIVVDILALCNVTNMNYFKHPYQHTLCLGVL